MSDAECVIYVKNAKNAISDVNAIRHMLCLDMAIWVLKVAPGLQEYISIPLNSL